MAEIQGFPSSLTDADMARISELAEPGPGDKRLSAYRIAQIMGRPPATVAWFMCRNGLQPRTKQRVRKPFMHRGALVRLFGPEEDAFMEDLRAEGAKLGAIAEAIEARFGWKRKTHSIHVRLVMLAGFEEVEPMGIAAESVPIVSSAGAISLKA